MVRTTSRWAPALLSRSLVLGALAAAPSLGCSGGAARPTTPSSSSTPKAVSATRISAFAVSNENLNVDKVGLRDGLNKPDGNRDLAFSLTVDGPFDAIFVVSVNAKGEPVYGLRADTLINTEEIPAELGGIIDTGKMTIGIGVVEGGRFINGESGSAHAGPGVHNLTLYIPNSATLQGGSNVRAYVRVTDGPLIPGPIAPY